MSAVHGWTPESLMEATETLAVEVGGELGRAIVKFPALNSPHEGLAVIEEEISELRQHVYGNTGGSYAARQEAIQVAAMAMRYVLDLTDEEGKP